MPVKKEKLKEARENPSALPFVKGEDLKLPRRPAILTPGLIKKIVRYIRADNYFETSCRACGITKQTGSSWLKRGEAEALRLEIEYERADKGETTAPVTNPVEEIYLEFFLAVDKADAEAEAEDIRDIRNGCDGWQSKMRLRESRDFKHWGRKERFEHTGEDGKSLFPAKKVVIGKQDAAVQGDNKG